jgi:3-methyladenine DNA glycosylase AlkD
MEAQLKAIRNKLKANASADTAASLAKFVPGIEKQYGVSMPVVNALAREFKSGGFELAAALANSAYVEEKILAAKLLGNVAKKDPARAFIVFQSIALNIDNWAVCDALGMQALKPLVKTHAADIFRLAEKYNRSKNAWLRRLSLVMVEWYTRDKTFHDKIKRLVKNVQDDDEYYVRKAVQWVNRNLDKGK